MQMSENTIISDYENLLKAKKFHELGYKIPCDNTFEFVSNSLLNDYSENIEQKAKRWIHITRFLYFKNVLPIKYYFQAKMLFRDGFYEAGITLSRGICEMICYELLSTTLHPFGDSSDIEKENFRTLVKFLAVPKEIGRAQFDKILCGLDNETKNTIKCSYTYDKQKSIYSFEINQGKTAKNLNKLHEIFESVSYKDKGSFTVNSYEAINSVYDIGNEYIHPKKHVNMPEKDAISCINGIGNVLFEFFGYTEIKANDSIMSGYNDFPDISTGMSFALDAYMTPLDAYYGDLNLPTPKQTTKFLSVQGIWIGRFQEYVHKEIVIHFAYENEYLDAVVVINGKTITPIEIQFFGDYFRLREFDEISKSHDREKHLNMKYEIFDADTLLGQDSKNGDKIILTRQKPEIA